MKAIAERATGFTLIEVLVSAALLIAAAAGIAQLTIVATRACESARTRTVTTLIAAQKMEQLRSLMWARDVSAGPLSDTSTDISRDPLASGGGGLRAGPAGTLDRNVDGYVDYLDAAGQWIGGGPDPPALALYVRRWAVLPLAADPDNTRVLIVMATTMRQEREVEGSGGRRPRLPDDTVLVALKTRQALVP
jgi:hypothetical protein